MTDNFNEKQARKRANLQKKAQDLQKNRDKYVGNAKKESSEKNAKIAQKLRIFQSKLEFKNLTLKR